VSAAGVRVRDTGVLRNDYDDRVDIYTPEEIWTFDLAFDVIATLGTLDGVDGETRGLVVSNMRSPAPCELVRGRAGEERAGEGSAGAVHTLRQPGTQVPSVIV
jgi:hypothetical protein